MSHRGRLNVLANVLQKSYKRIFNEFAGEYSDDSEDSAGDVKYHLGASSDRQFDGNSVHVSLTDNPSHLEAVNPVVLGQTRAKQFFHKDKERKKVIPVLMHGDAAFAGQGILAECFGMSGLPGPGNPDIAKHSATIPCPANAASPCIKTGITFFLSLSL